MARILIVEDEPDTARILKKRLDTEGFEVYVALDAYQGVETVHREKIDLIILDLMLPAGGGSAVLKSIKLSSKTSNIPVIILTALKSEEHKNKMLAEGADAFMEKPYDAEVLIANIRQLLDKKQG